MKFKLPDIKFSGNSIKWYRISGGSKVEESSNEVICAKNADHKFQAIDGVGTGTETPILEIAFHTYDDYADNVSAKLFSGIELTLENGLVSYGPFTVNGKLVVGNGEIIENDGGIAFDAGTPISDLRALNIVGSGAVTVGGVSVIPVVTTAPQGASGLKYNGENQELIGNKNAINISGKSKILYAVGPNDNLPDAGFFSENIPVGKDVDYYYVWYKVIGDNNHLDYGPVKIGGVSIDKGEVPIKEVSVNLHANDGATATVTLPTLPTGVSYGNVDSSTATKFTTTPANGGAMGSGNKVTVTANSSLIAGASETFKVAYNGGTNYDSGFITVTVNGTNLFNQTISASDVTTIYGATDAKVVASVDGEATGDGTKQTGELTYSAENLDGSTADVAVSVDTEGKITTLRAGTARIKIEAAETSDYAKATKYVLVTVDKKPLTVTAAPKTINIGDPRPDYKQQGDIVISGLLTTDRVEIFPDVDITPTFDSSKADIFTVTPRGIEIQNTGSKVMNESYDITYVSGTLTVSDNGSPANPVDVKSIVITKQPTPDRKTIQVNEFVTYSVSAVAYDKDGKVIPNANLTYAWEFAGPTGPVNYGNPIGWVTNVPGVHDVYCYVSARNKDGSTVQVKSNTVTLIVTSNSGGGSSSGTSQGGGYSSGGSGSLSRPPVTTPNSNKTATINNQNNNQNNNQTTNNDTPAGSNVPVSSYAHANAGRASQVIRLLNPASGEHIITTNAGEAEALIAEHGWKREAVAGTSSNANNSPVFRMFHAATGKHIYSMNAKEIAALAEQGWTNEGVTFFAGGSKVNMYRLFNSNLPTNVAHHFTTEEGEYNALQQQGWTGEGVAFTLD